MWERGMLALYFAPSVLGSSHPPYFRTSISRQSELRLGNRWTWGSLRVGPVYQGVRQPTPAGPQLVLMSAALLTAAPSAIISYP
jgi:hypothetical protein